MPNMLTGFRGPMLARMHKGAAFAPGAKLFMSEKLDGVRAVWGCKGSRSLMLTRNANTIEKIPAVLADRLHALQSRIAQKAHVPPKNLVLDGELWAGRGNFQKCVSLVRTASSDAEERWAFSTDSARSEAVETRKRLFVKELTAGKLPTLSWAVQYMLFDFYHPEFSFEKRYALMREAVAQEAGVGGHGDVLRLVESTPLKYPTGTKEATQAQITEMCRRFMKDIDKKKGGIAEGFMLRSATSLYEAGTRSRELVKVKGIDDHEGVCIGTMPGEGRLRGMVGALRCRWATKKGPVEFCVGSGLTDEQRSYKYVAKNILNRPVTIEHLGVTEELKPRHPVFIITRFDRSASEVMRRGGLLAD
eukprot:TRINITY_DN2753_c1_g1_i1.p1 TRINITY_DN2753_c1_g1~~TRINITY_DN2753_c1_g1_i1.p1  ORF type:complete len:361 (+),score=113.32 TRINITY_DN2753_c1_g1_i1:88-1170(+)